MSRKDIPTIVKETTQDRKERLRYSKCMVTKVVPNKKHKNRAQIKDEERKSENFY